MKKILVCIVLFSLFCFPAAFAQVEFGTASFYGVEFNGKPTASGEIYSQNKLTAAHKSLPLGTIVKVTNAQNNKSVFVKINDRGPYAKGRVIDLSTKAAELLGYRNKGTAYVKIEVIKEDSVPEDLMAATEDIAQQNGIKAYDSIIPGASSTPVAKEQAAQDKATTSDTPDMPQPMTDAKEANSSGITNRSPYFIITHLDKTKSGFYGLQLGVFSEMSVIFTLIEEIQKYNPSIVVQPIEMEGRKVYKLCVGKFQNRAYADALKSVLSDKFRDAFVVKYE